jgi:hypothetical protein
MFLTIFWITSPFKKLVEAVDSFPDNGTPSRFLHLLSGNSISTVWAQVETSVGDSIFKEHTGSCLPHLHHCRAKADSSLCSRGIFLANDTSGESYKQLHGGAAFFSTFRGLPLSPQSLRQAWECDRNSQGTMETKRTSGVTRLEGTRG